jgi:hypothetical protein
MKAEQLKQSKTNLHTVLEQLRLTGPERRQLEEDLYALYEAALDNLEDPENG